MQRDVYLSNAAFIAMMSLACASLGCDELSLPVERAIVDGDAGTQPSDPPPPPAPPPPLSAPPGQWTWLDVPGSECANGSPTGIGFNIGTSKDLVIFLEGGGACWSETACFASHLDGFGRSEWDGQLVGMMETLGRGGIFDRAAAKNPYKDSSFVYVPYCTGDAHAGDATAQFSSRVMHYSGRKNLEVFLTKIVPSFASLTRVTIGGRSAGGLGAVLDYWRVKRAFGAVRVDLIDDSAPPFDPSKIAPFSEWAEAWKLADAFPPDCAECKMNLGTLLPFYSRTNPSSRFALLSFDHDTTVEQFYAQSPEEFRANIKDMTEKTMGPLPNAKYFVVDALGHTMTDKFDRESQGKRLGDWLHDFATDSSSWTFVSPL